jgi:UDP-N-acetylglucosamine 2-epimerase (non-hydrolysing)
MKILAVVGARPNFIKIAPLLRRFNETDGMAYTLIHTGQHYDVTLSQVFFEQLDIPTPDHYLGVGSGTHGVQTGKTMMKIEEVLMEGDYDLVCAVGDVNSTLAAALAAVKLQVPVAHIEAGYRSFDMRMPEEINRVLVDRVSQLLFAPTETAVLNLINEGIPQERIFLVGNIMCETLLMNMDKMSRPEGVDVDDYVLLTAHRAENTDDPARLRSILEGASASDLPVIFPAHPRTVRKLDDLGMRRWVDEQSTIRIIEPLTYLDFQYALSHARCVLTDSGGVQEEALMHHVPCLTLRTNTERMITLQYGANRLVGTNADRIGTHLKDMVHKGTTTWPIPPFWDEHVSQRIVGHLKGHKDLISIPSNDLIMP